MKPAVPGALPSSGTVRAASIACPFDCQDPGNAHFDCIFAVAGACGFRGHTLPGDHPPDLVAKVGTHHRIKTSDLLAFQDREAALAEFGETTDELAMRHGP